MQKLNLTSIFVDLIGISDLKHHSGSNDYFYKKVLEIKEKNKNKISTDWRCDTFNTLYFYNLEEDIVFQNILIDIKNCVLKFAYEFGVENCELIFKNGWINLSLPGDYQEYHIHGENHFSVVYYIKTSPNCGNLVFKSHSSDKDDMFPIPLSFYTLPNYKTYAVKPLENNLIIFRSNLLHMVEKNRSDSDRVSISCNFYLKKI